MDGPPGSQGAIQRKGKKRKGRGHSASVQDSGNGSGRGRPQTDSTRTTPNNAPSPGAPSPALAPHTAAAAPETNGSRGAVNSETQNAGQGKRVPTVPELRDLTHPNIPLKAISLRSAYLATSGYASAAPSARSDASTGVNFATRFDFPPYPRGITNNSNFCFMNSILQALIFIPSVAQLAISAIGEQELCPTLSAMGRWMVQYWKPGLTRLCMQPPRLPFTMTGGSRGGGGGRPVAIVDGSAQQDAQEFLQRMLEVIHGELRDLEADARRGAEAEGGGEPNDDDESYGAGERDGGGDTVSSAPSTSSKGWTVVKGKERLTVRTHADRDGPRSVLLDAIFGGTLESHLKGKSKQRNHASVVVEQFYCLPIDIGFQMECTVEAAIERTMTTERIYDSDRDKELKKTLLLHQLPNVLFLHLRRWAVTAEGELVKLDNKVRFGRTLVLPRSVCYDDTLSNKARTYRLLSAVVHRGTAAGRGHYVTYLTANAANPTNVSVVGASGGEGPQPYSQQQLRSIQHPATSKKNAGGKGRGPAGAAASASPPARHLLDNPAHVLLCNDGKTTVCPAAEMLNETVYFLVYQRVG